MAIAAIFIDVVERQMRDELVPRGGGSSEVEGECNLRGVGEIEGNSAPLNHPTNDITPFDVERPVSGQGRIKTVREIGGLISFYRLRQNKFVGSCRTAYQNGESRERRGA